MYQYNNHNQRRSGLRLDVQKRRKKEQRRKRIIIIAFTSAMLLAVFAVLSANGIINIRGLFGKDNDFKPPVYTDSDTQKTPDTPVATDTEGTTPDTTETERVPQTTETTPPPVTTPPVTTPQVTEPVTSEPDTTETTPPDTQSDDTTDGGDSSSDPSSDSSSDSSSESSSDEPSSDSESGNDIIVSPPENRFEWPCVLSETAPATDDYFADTLFIGDSRMQGVELACSKESAATFYTAVSVTASQIDTREGVNIMVNGAVQKVTIIDAIKQSGRQFKRIYMMFGINELGSGGGTPAIIRGYKSAVEKVREIQPEAQICILGVMPVFNSCKYVSGYKGYEANPRILDLNIAMIEMANELKLHYLDTYHLFATEDGQLDPAHSSEGIHLSGKSSKLLMEYVKTHAIPTNN